MSKENQAKSEYCVGDWVTVVDVGQLMDAWLGVVMRVARIYEGQKYPVGCLTPQGNEFPAARHELRPATAVEILTAKLRGSL